MIVTILITAVLFWIIGILSVFGYALFRGRKSTWDDSNIINPIRFYAHVILHPEDFAQMQYEDGSKPFWYLPRDEFSEVVKSRPKKFRGHKQNN